MFQLPSSNHLNRIAIENLGEIVRTSKSVKEHGLTKSAKKKEKEAFFAFMFATKY